MKLSNIKILTNRISYECQVDDLRLSSLVTPRYIEAIKQQFNFHTAAVGPPIPTFGDVAATFPPGLVFNLGFFVGEEERVIPIRFMHFEQRRIVIDAAGSPTDLARIFAHLQFLFEDEDAFDGSPIIGGSGKLLSYSEITFSIPGGVNNLFRPNTLSAIRHTVKTERGSVLTPIVFFVIEKEDQESRGVVINPTNQMLQLSIRAGTTPSDDIYFSGAPLDSDKHLELLETMFASGEEA